ncbi:hypothetical protein AB0O01_25950 [Streptomyces sp. NPDC093252]|uniref:hypothetical protein n=1 Tax=Streptomyces sp. NPDC093252 TaxID=3154980 RepID=UPI0034409F33
MNKWREDAQPEWPAPATKQGDISATGATTRESGGHYQDRDGDESGDAEADSGPSPAPSDADGPGQPAEPFRAFEPRRPKGGAGPGGGGRTFGALPADGGTAAAADAGETEVLPTTDAGPGSASRHGGAPPVGSWGVPLTGATEVLPPAAARRPVPGDGTAVLPPVGVPLRDPWGQMDDKEVTGARGAAHAHDPHEVTVQMDAVQVGEGGVVRAAPGDGPEGGDGPVFVDATGRRSRRYRRIGMAVAVACAVYAVVIVATLMSGNSHAPWLPVPGQQDGQPAGQVDTTPEPRTSAESADPSATAPGPSPSATEDTTPSPGAGPTATEEATASADPRTSEEPEPPAGTGGTATKPGTGPTDSGTEPSSPATTSSDPGTPTGPPSTPQNPDPSTTPPGEAGGGTGDGAAAVQGGAASPLSSSTTPRTSLTPLTHLTPLTSPLLPAPSPSSPEYLL